MKKFKLYENDLSAPNLRDNGEETTEEVVARWFDADVYYEAEDLSACEGSKAVDQYYSITAERILLRKKVLGLCNDDEIARSEKLLASHPFLGSDLTLGTLLSPEINVAMALVPLTPLDEQSDRNPELARLYCVKGVSGQNDIPFESGFPIGADCFGWFLCGCDKTAKPDGESWHLAAHLLMRVVEDVHRKKNLAIHFVVTGRVQSDEIKPVEMGRKSELADVWEFKDLRWIMQEDNKMNMNNAMRKVETPKTLKEALELIETLQNKATRSFFRFLSNGDLAGAKEQFEIGADIFACEESTGQMPMEILGELIKKEAKQPSDKEQKLHPNGKTRLMRLNEMMTWLKAQGADCALMFYLLAKYGLDDALKSCLKIWPIEARSANGLNATELALESGDYDVALKLCALGCKCCSKARNSFLTNAVNSYFNQGSAKSKQLVECALSVGLSPDSEYHSGSFEMLDGEIVHGYSTSIFGAALYNGDYNLVKKCLDAGADPNSTIAICRYDPALKGVFAEDEDCYSYTEKDCGSPLYIVNCLWATGEEGVEDRDKISALLISRGAKKDVRVAQWQYAREVEKYLTNGSSKSKNQVLKFIDEGQSFDIQVSVKYTSADDAPKTEELRTTLWGAAVYYGDVELMRKCLEHGASATAKLHFAHVGDEKVVDLQYLNGRSPVEVLLMSEDIPLLQQNSAFELLKEYGLKDSDCPSELLETRHCSALAKLVGAEAVKERCTVEMGGPIECPELGTTDMFGMAVWCMWVDVLERCLSLGASARNVIHYEDVGPNGMMFDVVSETPRQIIDKRKSYPTWQRNRALKLLAKYSNR